MKAKLIIENQEFDIEILDPELQQIITPKKTGYEQVANGEKYWYVDYSGGICRTCDDNEFIDDKLYSTANYYSTEEVAINNARADKLMRQIRRFAVEHDSDTTKEWLITWSVSHKALEVHHSGWAKTYGAIYFASYGAANEAIEKFEDELTWYFTEYQNL